MNLHYFQIPADKALKFIENNISDENLNALYDKYNIEDDKLFDKKEQLTEVISDSDLYALGYKDEDEEVKEEVEYKYSDVDDIIDFLAHCVDEDIIEKLYQQYDCYSIEDLALALTDYELQSLGYCYINDEEIPTTEFSCEYDNNSEYDEDLDYLEDIPDDLKFIIVDKDNGIFAVDSESDYFKFKESVDPVLIDSCESLDNFVDDTDKYLFKVEKHSFEVPEEVIINTELNSAIFDSEHKMLPEIKEKLTDYINKFIQKMSDKDVNIDYSDICLVGSNAGYLYTPESDIDIHIISTNPLDINDAENLYNEADIFETENPLMIGDSNVEIGIEDGYDITMDNKDARRYSIISNEWVNDSDKLEEYKPEDVSTVDGYEEIVDKYTEEINNAVDNDEYKIAVALKQEIRQNRSNDLANIGSLSMGNVVFKELRNNGSYKKLKDYIASKELME